MPDATILPMPPGEGPRPATGFTLITGLSGAGRSEAACWLVAQNGAENVAPSTAPNVARAPV